MEMNVLERSLFWMGKDLLTDDGFFLGKGLYVAIGCDGN
jgi:hypothetical protein